MNFFNRKEKSGAKPASDNLQEVLKRLASHAGNTIKMLKSVLATDKGMNYSTLLMYSAGLAGYACQRAVIANNDQYAVVGTKNGKKYYFGDGVNAYLLENKGSVLSFMSDIYEHKTREKAPDPTPSIQLAVSMVGNDEYKIWNSYPPDSVYNLIKDCWNGIFENMTIKYCETPSEWPIFFGIVLQNIMADGMNNGREDAVYHMALECALFISKMRDDSLAQN